MAVATDGAVRRYSRVAMALHWLIAGLIVMQILIGWQMEDLKGGDRLFVMQWHKSFGITILLLTALRLLWRLTHRPPPYAAGVTGWQHALASAAHVGFYILLIVLPVTGWVMVSVSPYNIPTLLFGVIPWPHLPGLPDLPGDTKKAIGGAMNSAHSALVWGTIVLLALHVAGALKHTFLDKDGTLWRMLPFGGARA